MTKEYYKFINEVSIIANAHGKITSNDLRLLRKGIKAELEAINEYDEFAELADNEQVKTLFLDISKEEKVHAEEFEQLLERLDPDYEETENDAEDEIDTLFGKTIE